MRGGKNHGEMVVQDGRFKGILFVYTQERKLWGTILLGRSDVAALQLRRHFALRTNTKASGRITHEKVGRIGHLVHWRRAGSWNSSRQQVSGFNRSACERSQGQRGPYYIDGNAQRKLILPLYKLGQTGCRWKIVRQIGIYKKR
jgi:hypothetical protein